MKAEIVKMVVRIFEVILGLADLKRETLQNQRGLERGGKEGADFGDLKATGFIQTNNSST